MLSNGTIQLHDSEETTFGLTASVSCEQGFISAVDTVTCRSSGLWDPIPICQKHGKSNGFQPIDAFLMSKIRYQSFDG